jgi:hypothetical protein
MKNPLKLYYNLVLKADILNTVNIIDAEDEKLSLYGDDITLRIKMEVGLVLERIDEEYWKNDRISNEYFFDKLLNISTKLISQANALLEKQMIQLLKICDLDKWLMTYNNIQAVYEGLIDIRNCLTKFYFEDLKSRTDAPELNLRYVYLLKEFAKELKQLCLTNLGKEDTFYNCITPDGKHCIIEVLTSQMSPTLAEIEVKAIDLNKELLDEFYTNNQVSKKQKPLLVWNDTPKVFVDYFEPIIKKRIIGVGNNTDRDPVVKALYDVFTIFTNDKKTKQQIPLSRESLVSYFKLRGSEERT